MTFRKRNILSLGGLILAVLFLLTPDSNVAAAKYDPSDVTAMSALNFWNKATGKSIGKEDNEYIVCGTAVCNPVGTKADKSDAQRCVQRVTSRTDLVTIMSNASMFSPSVAHKVIGATIRLVRGDGTVTDYEYKCVSATAKLDSGWSEAPEGGFVVRREVTNGGWFPKVEEQGICADGSDSGTYCLATKGGGRATVAYNMAGTAFKGCEVLPVKLYNSRKCFFCPLFAVMYKVAGEITDISFHRLAAAFAAVLILGWAIWVAVQTLTHVSSLTKQDAPKFLTNLIKQSYKVLIAFLLLQYSGQIFKYAVTPILEGGLAFGDAMLEDRFKAIEVSEDLDAMAAMEEKNPGITKRVSMLTNTAYYGASLYIKLDNFVVNLQRNIAFMQSVGSSLICIGGHGMVKTNTSIKFWEGFVIVIQGVMLAAFSFLMALAFAFYLLDAVVQLGLVGALMPFLIASWPFKISSKYTKIGWNMLLNSAFIFMFAGMVVAVDLGLINAAVDFTASSQENVANDDGSCKDGDDCEVNMGSLYALAQAINTQNEEDLKKLTDISGIGFLILLFCCIFALQFMNRTQEMAGKFAGGALKPIAPSIATIGASAAKSFALKSTKATREAVGRKWDQAVGFLGSLPGRAISAAKNRQSGKSEAAVSSGAHNNFGNNNASNSGNGNFETPNEEPEDIGGEGNENSRLTDNEGSSTSAQSEQRTSSPEPRKLNEGSSVASAPSAVSAGNFNQANNTVERQDAPNLSTGKAKVEQARKAGIRKNKNVKSKHNSRKGRKKRYGRRKP